MDKPAHEGCEAVATYEWIAGGVLKLRLIEFIEEQHVHLMQQGFYLKHDVDPVKVRVRKKEDERK